MGLLHRARVMVQRLGLDVSRYPGFDPVHMLVRLLGAHGIDVVIDVGANSGRYASELRHAGFAGRIVSLEPLSGPFAALSRLCADDPKWTCLQYAIGEEDGTATLNVAGNGGESSSILPMLPAHSDAYPAANYVATEQVRLRRLDSLYEEILRPSERAFLKVDVQGYERAVIAGAHDTLVRQCAGMQLELSLTPLYEGSMQYREAIDLADGYGYALMSVIPGFVDLRDGRLLQADGVFLREK